MICDELPGHMKSICLGTHLRADGSSHSPEDRAGIVSKVIKRTVSIDELPDVAQIPPAQRSTVKRVSAPRERVGTFLKSRIEKLITIKTGKGCGCKNLAADMDRWGIAGCELRRDEIVRHLVGNRSILADALRTHGALGHAAGLAIEFVPEIVLRAGASVLLDQAIADTRNHVPVRKPPITRARQEPRQKGPRKPAKSGMEKFISTLKAEQHRLHTANQQAPPPEPDPFIGKPVLHFGAHLWPVRNNWEWHVDIWNEVAKLINGRCVVGVATDSSTSTVEEVRHHLSGRFEIHHFQNQKEGENQTFRMLQSEIPHEQDDVLIYCHGKGVRQHTAASEAVKRWTEAMYQTVVLNHDTIVEKLADGYKNVHAFRTFGKRPLSPKNLWHPSGTFFAVRAKYLPNRAVKERYGGVEAWCGDHFTAAESWCEFFDNSMFTTLYDHEMSREVVAPMLTEWWRKQNYERD